MSAFGRMPTSLWGCAGRCTAAHRYVSSSVVGISGSMMAISFSTSSLAVSTLIVLAPIAPCRRTERNNRPNRSAFILRHAQWVCSCLMSPGVPAGAPGGVEERLARTGSWKFERLGFCLSLPVRGTSTFLRKFAVGHTTNRLVHLTQVLSWK